MKRKQIVEKSISIQEAFEQFQRFNQTKNLSPETIRYHDNHSKPFFAFLEDVSQPVDSITKEKIDAYILHLKAKGTVNDTTINTRLRMVRGFLYYCMKRGLMPSFQIAQIRTTQPIKEPYTNAELALLLKKPNIKACSFARYRNWVIVNFLLATGCRASTLVNIRIEDVDLTGGMVLFRHMKTRTQQMVPLSKTIIGILEEYLAYRDGQPSEPLFISEYGNALKVDTLDSCIREYNLSCGVQKTSLHLFRHTYAKLFITAGGDPFRLQKLLGHSDLTMTKRYVALYAEDLKENYDKLNPLEQLSTGRNRNRVKLNVAQRCQRRK